MPTNLSIDEIVETVDERHQRALDWFKQWEEATWENRQEAVLDRDYYDGIQWTQDELDDLEDRGQPAVTVNKIGPKINFMLGVESTNQVDPRAYPRTEKHEDDSDIATDALNFATDEADYDWKRSYAAKHQMIEGIGGLMLGVIEKIQNESRRVLLTLTPIEYDRIWYDPRSRQPDFADARYTGIVVWRDFDEAEADPIYKGMGDMFESTRGQFADASSSMFGDSMEDAPRRWYDEKTRRIQIFEVYWRERDKKGNLVWWGGHFTRAGWLIEPFVVGFRNDLGESINPMHLVSGFIDRNGLRYGVVRWMRSPQDEINKRRSKLMHHLSTNQVIYEDNAIAEIEEFMEEAAKPDGKMEVRRGALVSGAVQIRSTQEMAQGQMQVYQAAIAELDQTGPGGSGDAPANSAKEFQARQEVGSMQMQPIFANLRRLDLAIFKNLWWLIRQNWRDDMWLRVRDDEENKGWRFKRINRRITKGQRVTDLIQHGREAAEAVGDVFGPVGKKLYQQLLQQFIKRAQEVSQQAAQEGETPPEMNPQKIALDAVVRSKQGRLPFTENDVAQVDVDIKIEVTDASPTVQQAQHEMLVGFLHRMQSSGFQVPQKWVEMVIMSSPLQDKRKLIAKLNEPPPPEVIQQQQAQAQAQMARMQAEIDKLKADAVLKGAQAQKAGAQAEAVVVEANKAIAATAKILVETEAIEEGALAPSRGVANDSALQ